MHHLKLIPLLLASSLILSCGTESQPEKWTGKWENLSSNNYHVNTLSYANGFLFEGTTEGVYKLQINNSNNWLKIGLDTDTTEVTKIIAMGSNNLLATISYNTIRKEDKILFKSIDGGNSWTGWPLELANDSNKYSYLYFLEYNPGNPDALFGYDGSILHSNNSGKIWHRVFTGGASEFLYVSKDHPNQIWTGGWNNTFSPYLAKSTDGGVTWVSLSKNIFYGADSSVFSVVISPKDENKVLAGIGGFIRKSKDGGVTWKTVLENYHIRVLKNSLQRENRVYASGLSPEGQLFVAVSNNYGDSWEIETYEGSPAGVQTNDMVVADVQGQETLFLGTNQGVYSLMFESN